MMEFISIPVTFGIGAYAFYKLVELFARKKERIMIIERLSQISSTNIENLDISRIFGESKSFSNKFLALRIGSLLMGLGLGLLVGIGIANNIYGVSSSISYETLQSMSVVYGASTLCFGGLGLIIGFIVEAKMSKDK
jgi:predicted nucleic acid-binding OB-fold protein